jgi:hypothetical protein
VGDDQVIDKQKEIVRAVTIRKSLGTRVAARYLALRGWSIEAALYVLLGKGIR